MVQRKRFIRHYDYYNHSTKLVLPVIIVLTITIYEILNQNHVTFFTT